MAALGHAREDSGVIGPFARVPAHRRDTIGRTALLVLVILFGSITLLGAPLRTSAAPLGLVSLQFAGSPGAAELMLATWGEAARGRLLWAHGLDLVLPFAYASAIGLRAVAAATSAPRMRGPATLAVWSALAAASADQVENVAMFVTMLAAPSWSSVLVTLVAATVKWAMLAMAVGTLAVAMSGARAEGRLRA